jgi:hypothetical protein
VKTVAATTAAPAPAPIPAFAPVASPWLTIESFEIVAINELPVDEDAADEMETKVGIVVYQCVDVR